MTDPLVVGTPVLLLRGVGRHTGTVKQVIGTRGLLIAWDDGLESLVSPQEVGSIERPHPSEREGALRGRTAPQ